MNGRIFGIETEYGLARIGQALSWSSKEAVRKLFGANEYSSQSSTFLPNGGRLYVDVGDHPEYATAECNQLIDLVAQDRAGDQLLSDLLTEVNRATDSPSAKLRLFRNNFDAQNNSFGCHENYLISRRSEIPQSQAFLTFLITRTIFTGAGRIVPVFSTQPEPVGARYLVGARTSSMDSVLSSHTTSQRPIINTRDQPLSDPRLYRRLHVIVGDTNVNEFSTAFKVGATLLVISALEKSGDWVELALDNPIAALQSIGEDTTLTTKVKLADGRSLSAAQLQAEVFQRVEAANIIDSFADDPLIMELWSQWQDMIVAAERRDFASLSSRVDWILKKELLERFRQQTSSDWYDAKVRNLEWEYHCVSGRLRRHLEEKGLMHRLTTPAVVDNAAHNPPESTRAYARGRLIGWARQHCRDYYADWNCVRIGIGEGATMDLTDPFSVDNQAVSELIAQLESLG